MQPKGWRIVGFNAICMSSLQWRHNERDGVSNHQPHDCLLNLLFGRRSKKTSKLKTSLAFLRGIHRSPVNSPQKGPVTRKMFPFDDVIMCNVTPCSHRWVSVVFADAFVRTAQTQWGVIKSFLMQMASQLDCALMNPGQNGRHFADEISKCIFLNENIWIWLTFHWNLSYKQYSSIGSDTGLAPTDLLNNYINGIIVTQGFVSGLIPKLVVSQILQNYLKI